MLLYDLSGSRLFDAQSRADLPRDAEMFVVTVALLLCRRATYSSLSKQEVCFHDDDFAEVAECIEHRLRPFAQEMGPPESWRERLREFVGLRIGREAIIESGTDCKGRR